MKHLILRAFSNRGVVIFGALSSLELIMAVTNMNHWIEVWQKGPRFLPYLFSVLAITALIYFLDGKYESSNRHAWKKIVLAFLYGFISSVLAAQISEVCFGHYMDRFIGIFKMPLDAIIFGLFCYPVIIGGWIFSLVVAGALSYRICLLENKSQT